MNPTPKPKAVPAATPAESAASDEKLWGAFARRARSRGMNDGATVALFRLAVAHHATPLDDRRARAATLAEYRRRAAAFGLDDLDDPLSVRNPTRWSDELLSLVTGTGWSRGKGALKLPAPPPLK